MIKPCNISLLNHNSGSVSIVMHGVFQRSYQREADLIGVGDFPPLKRTAKDLKDTERTFFGLCKSGALAGVIEVELAGTGIEICSLVVDPPYFRQGVASRLINHVLHTIDRKHAVVETAAANRPAINLYEKHGFSEDKRWVSPHGILKVRLRTK